MDIEEVARERPEKLAAPARRPAARASSPYQARQLAFRAKIDPGRPNKVVATMLAALPRLRRARRDARGGQPADPDRPTARWWRSTPSSRSTTTPSSGTPSSPRCATWHAQDPQERMAHERGVTYVKLDGDVGILGNGAGLVMSTLDVVAAGRRRARPTSSTSAAARRPTRSSRRSRSSSRDDKVKALLVNIFGGITRCDEVAEGISRARAASTSTLPIVVRLDGTNERGGPRDPRRARPGQRRRRADDARRPPGGRVRAAPSRRCRHEHPRRQGHAAGGAGHHRPRGRVPRDPQQGRTAPRSSPASRRARAARTSRASRCSTPSATPCRPTGANTAMVFVPPRFARRRDLRGRRRAASS